LIGHVVEVVPTICGWGPTPRTSLPTRLISAAFQPAATAPRVSHVWQATKAELRGLNREFSLNIGIGFARRLVMLHTVRTESSLKEIDDAAMFKLASLNLKQIVSESEDPETCIAQLA
jgi:hypothetical protein